MRNITLRQYAALADVSQYDILDRTLKPNNSFVGRQMNINSMPYVNVKHCIRLMYNANTWEVIQQLFEICFDVNAKKFWKVGIVEFLQAKKYMVEEFNRVISIEVKMLQSHSTDEQLWQMAGADRLKPFSDTLPLMQLGKLFGMYPFDIGRKPYSEVFNLLVQAKVQNEVEAEYSKLKNQ